MKKLNRLTGGYKRHVDYLLTLQNEVMSAQNSMFKRLNHDLILDGCAVTDNRNGTVNIAPGVAYVGGQIVQFQGANNIPADGSRAFSLSAPVTTDPQEFFDGSTKNVYSEQYAEITTITNVATQVVVGPILYDIPQYMNDIVQSYGQKGEFKDVYDFDGSFIRNFDSSGLGITARWQGWALANGNNGTPNLQGRVRITSGRIVDAGIQYVYGNGNTGGEVRHKLTVNEMPKHDHGMQASEKNSDKGTGVFQTNNSFSRYYQSQSAGGDQDHNNMQPYFVGYTVIKIV